MLCPIMRLQPLRKRSKELLSRFGVPLEVYCDRGRNFEGKVFQNLSQIIGIQETKIIALHPQSDRMVEKMKHAIGKYLPKTVSGLQRY